MKVAHALWFLFLRPYARKAGRAGKQEDAVTRAHRLNILKTAPGFLISAFFLWWTFVRVDPRTHKRGFDPAAFHGLHLIAPAWLVSVVVFSVAGYTLRCYRWWAMLRSVRAPFAACSRIFITSLAANNILPLRIGDVMRIFTYAGDLNATPSIVLSTVLLEKFLDVFTLGTLFVVTAHMGALVPAHIRQVSEACVVISAVGLLVMVFGARTLEPVVKRLFARTANATLRKVEHWLLLALDCVRQIGVTGTLLLVVYSFAAWACEGMLYVSVAKAIGLAVDRIGPWQAVAEGNLSFLIPSSPGGIGPFELACKDAMVRHGVMPADAGLFGLLVHAWLFVALTLTGGVWFLLHRAQRAMRKPLGEELETLPTALP